MYKSLPRWVKFMAGFACGLCFWAYQAGVEMRIDARTITVPVSTVDPNVCVANGPIAYVTEHPNVSGVYSAHCADGVVLTTPHR